MKTHRKHYERLQGEERFHLYLAAMARDDHAEAAALCDSCPTYNYSMRDWSFHHRENACRQLMIALALELAPHLATLRELKWQASYLSESVELLGMTGFDAAIEAHWRVVDPEGTPESRIKSNLQMPDTSTVMAGPAGVAFTISSQLKKIHRARRDREVQTLANIISGFDQFTCERWALSGDVAIAAYSELFADLEDYLPAASVPVLDAASTVADRFASLWTTLEPVQ